ncbi:MAG: 3-hydroxyacyl-CoA dehydrogenase [Georgfuchsia sp.]
MLDVSRKDLILGIVGTGLMGRGIAQIAAQAEVRVILYDARPDAATEARVFIRQTLDKLAQKGKLTAADVDASMARVDIASSLEQLAPCHIVVEAIIEDMGAKRDLFNHLENIVQDGCVLATNTSSLSVTAIAAGCRLPSRVGGLHFFSPVPLMKVVEVIDGMLTATWASDALTALTERIGHTPVHAQDTPGFIVNHAGRGYGPEALRIVGEGIADVAEIDQILRDAAGFRMGPFELFDLTGLDVSHPAMESIYNQYYQEPRYRPSPITRQRLAAGLLGRKSGAGFYEYHDGQAKPSPGSSIPTLRPALVWISRSNQVGHDKVRTLVQTLGGTIDEGILPTKDSLCVVLPIGTDATTTALAEGLDPTRTVALDTLFLNRRRTVMTTPVTAASQREAAHGLFAADGIPVSVIHDSPGFVAQRVVAMIVNIGCDIAQQRIASPNDIDRAVNLGLGYPKGPLAMGDALGASNVLAILDGMHALYRDPRYRPSPWLTRRAKLGISLLTPEN